MTLSLSARAVLAATAATATLAPAILTSGPAAAASQPAPCTGAQVHVSHSRTDGAAGHGRVLLFLRNAGANACALRGYPGVDALGPHGGVLAHARRSLRGMTGGASAVRTIVVRPGRFASADLEWSTVPTGSGSCRTSRSIAITPPNTTKTVHRLLSLSTCSLQIHPVVAGRSGNS